MDNHTAGIGDVGNIAVGVPFSGATSGSSSRPMIFMGLFKSKSMGRCSRCAWGRRRASRAANLGRFQRRAAVADLHELPGARGTRSNSAVSQKWTMSEYMM